MAERSGRGWCAGYRGTECGEDLPEHGAVEAGVRGRVEPQDVVAPAFVDDRHPKLEFALAVVVFRQAADIAIDRHRSSRFPAALDAGRGIRELFQRGRGWQRRGADGEDP